MLGEGVTAVAPLERLVRSEPLRERPRGQLMLALYRSGRAPEALEVFQSYRRVLADELGLEPGPSLHDLQRRILEHDPTLAPVTSRLAPLRSGRSRMTAIVAAGAALVLVTGVAVHQLTERSTSARLPVSFPAVVEIGGVSHSPPARLTSTPGGSTAGAGSVWVTEPDAAEIVRIEPRSGAIVDRIPVVGNPGPIGFAAGAVWVTDVLGSRVVRIDPGTDRITKSIELGTRRATALATSGTRLWIADVTENALVEIDAGSASKLRTILLEHRPSALVADRRTIWVASYDAGTVDAVDRRTGETVASVHVGNGPVALAATRNAIWVANSLDSTVARIDPTTGLVASVLPVGSAPSSLAIARDSVWVGNEYGGSVTRIDPRLTRVTSTASVGGATVSLAALGDRVWVGIRPLAQHRGGKLVLLHERPLTIEPTAQFRSAAAAERRPHPGQPRHVRSRRRARRSRPRPRSGRQPADAHRRRSHVHLPPTTRDSLLEWSICWGGGLSPEHRAHVLSRLAVQGSLRSDPGYRGMRGGFTLRPLAGHRHRRGTSHGHLSADTARAVVPRELDELRNGSRPERDGIRRSRNNTPSDSRHRAVPRRFGDGAGDSVRAESLLPRVVACCAAGRESRRDRHALRPYAPAGGTSCCEWNGRLDCRSDPAELAAADRRALRRSAAHLLDDRDRLLPLQHESIPVRRRAGAARGQSRSRPKPHCAHLRRGGSWRRRRARCCRRDWPGTGATARIPRGRARTAPGSGPISLARGRWSPRPERAGGRSRCGGGPTTPRSARAPSRRWREHSEASATR